MDIIVNGDHIGRVRTRRSAEGSTAYTAHGLNGPSLGTFPTYTEARDALIDKSGIGDAGDGRVRTLTGTWELVHEDRGVLTVGSDVEVWSPDGGSTRATVTKVWPPHKPSSEGKIDYVDAAGNSGGCYAGVVGAWFRCLEGAGTGW